MIKLINENSPGHVYAVPFYKDLEQRIRDNVEEITNKNIRNNFFRFPKNKDIRDKISIDEMVEPGTYTQFVIVATNIAEASITIDSLGFVIDDGKQKTNYYDYNIRNTKLLTENIANPNRLQRKGRVGRVKPGIVFYTYLSSPSDFKELKQKVQYKFCNEDVTTYIINFINNITGEKEINANNDPSLFIDFDTSLLPEFIKKQYEYKTLNVNENEIVIYPYYFFVKKHLNERNYIKENIFYPYKDSKFDVNDIIDDKGKFFIIHPDDDNLIRNKNLDIINIIDNNNIKELVKLDDNGNIILKKNRPIEKKEYINKVDLIIGILKDYYIIDDNYKITNIGKIIQDILSEGFFLKTESVLCILDIIKNYENFNYDYIIFLIIYMEGIRLRLSNQIKKFKFNDIKSDIINVINLFPKKLLDEILLYDINSYNRSENIRERLVFIDNEIEFKSKIIFKNFGIKKNLLVEDITNLTGIFIKYNKIKIRIQIYKDRFNLFERYTKIKEKYQEFDNKDKIFEDDLEIINQYESDKTNILYNKQSINIVKNIEVNVFNNFEKMCYFAVKYYFSNVIINVPRTEFYLNYFNPNINIIYQISKYTNLNIFYRLNYLFYCSNNDNNLDILTFIPYKIINKIIKDQKKKIKKNDTSLDLKYIKDNFTKDYDKIIKKIDIIIQYIKNIQ
jgi:hypothetical protein